MSRKPSALTSALNSSGNLASSSGSSERSSHGKSNGTSLHSRVPKSAFPCLYTDVVDPASEHADEFSADQDPDALNFSRLSFSSAGPGSYRRPSSIVSGSLISHTLLLCTTAKWHAACALKPTPASLIDQIASCHCALARYSRRWGFAYVHGKMVLYTGPVSNIELGLCRPERPLCQRCH